MPNAFQNELALIIGALASEHSGAAYFAKMQKNLFLTCKRTIEGVAG
jgi:hypothetical protein